jgi:hypothetical protein
LHSCTTSISGRLVVQDFSVYVASDPSKLADEYGRRATAWCGLKHTLSWDSRTCVTRISPFQETAVAVVKPSYKIGRSRRGGCVGYVNINALYSPAREQVGPVEAAALCPLITALAENVIWHALSMACLCMRMGYNWCHSSLPLLYGMKTTLPA